PGVSATPATPATRHAAPPCPRGCVTSRAGPPAPAPAAASTGVCRRGRPPPAARPTRSAAPPTPTAAHGGAPPRREPSPRAPAGSHASGECDGRCSCGPPNGAGGLLVLTEQR